MNLFVAVFLCFLFVCGWLFADVVVAALLMVVANDVAAVPACVVVVMLAVFVVLVCMDIYQPLNPKEQLQAATL